MVNHETERIIKASLPVRTRLVGEAHGRKAEQLTAAVAQTRVTTVNTRLGEIEEIDNILDHQPFWKRPLARLGLAYLRAQYANDVLEQGEKAFLELDKAEREERLAIYNIDQSELLVRPVRKVPNRHGRRRMARPGQ